MRFFVLEQIIGSPDETAFESVEPLNLGEASRCARCGQPTSLLPWLAPHRAKLMTYGTVPGDVAFGVGDELLVSDKFRRGWLEHGLTGIHRFEPVQVVRTVGPAWKKAGAVTPFFSVSILGSSTEIDEARSMLDQKGTRRCADCRSGMIRNGIGGFVIDEKTWTGEDLFRPRGSGMRVVTDKVGEMAAAYDLKNVHLIPVEDYTWGTLERGKRKVN